MNASVPTSLRSASKDNVERFWKTGRQSAQLRDGGTGILRSRYDIAIFSAQAMVGFDAVAIEIKVFL
jgi:hypothetical protein